jgi:intracellular septation protein
MAVTAVAMVISLVRFGKVTPIQIFSAAMVLVLGGLTIWLHKDWIIKIKPTIYYVTVSAVLLWGVITGRPTLQMVLGQAYPGLSPEGWRLLTRNWAFFFLAMAIANEVVWRNFSTTTWLGYKLWGAMPATVIFAACNVPLLMRHGLDADDNKVVLPPEE